MCYLPNAISLIKKIKEKQYTIVQLHPDSQIVSYFYPTQFNIRMLSQEFVKQILIRVKVCYFECIIAIKSLVFPN